MAAAIPILFALKGAILMAVGGAIGALIRRYTEEHGEEIVEAIKNQDYRPLPEEG